ncbi:putative alpha-1,6-mannanase (GH76 family) [Diaminobutyricimonas aerilata]|uniref:Putative alpha-1,6-mannanase (GH76 family) n=1 Tax=Diaminobutyricimonas aerilata TaxID=1162967 RepID=A0A2M9CP03_9MICO|nr:glycoside hydrolase family 76 protein [Diaminobutyricimonas aerilata]PJJ73637.1 putative alpha-1,6-mannanase (GH76 family) [Diaminobutyricimonas aerilata]
MKRRMLLAASLALATATAVGVSVPATALTTDQATDAFESFVDVYWDPQKQYFYTYSDRVVHPEHAHGPEGGLYTDYWWEAQLWHTVMDRYERAGDAQSRAMIDQVFDGFQAAYPKWNENDWNDDIGWWAQGAIRAYDLTGDKEYLKFARKAFDFIAKYEDSTYGGGIWWKNVDIGNGSLNQKNVATNGAAIETAVRLYEETGKKKYLETAQRLFAWLDSSFVREDGKVSDHFAGAGELTGWEFTYNQGNFAGAALALYRATGEERYLDRAVLAVDWAVDNLTNSGVFLNEGDNDTGGFKAVLTRVMRDLIDDGGQEQYEAVLTLNASAAAHSVNSQGIGSIDWASPAPEPEQGAIQSLAAGGVAAITNQAEPDGDAGIAEGTGVYEPENSARDRVNTESSNPGFTGRGYLAGWIADGSKVTFHVNVAASGERDVTLRYAAGAGDATRHLRVNGELLPVVTLPGTNGWGNWQQVTVPLTLDEGHNSIEVIAPIGGGNYVNLDSLTVELTE